MKILPMMSEAVVMLHEDGKSFEMVPLQVFRAPNGYTCIRYGRNVLFFNKDGSFDGTESTLNGVLAEPAFAEELKQAFAQQRDNHGKPPLYPYFGPWREDFRAAELAAWPPDARPREHA